MTTPRKGADLLAIGFGTTVIMWTLFYVAALPPGSRALWVVIIAACVAGLFGAGFVAGRFAGRRLAGGAGLGALITGINLLILMSLLGGDETGAAGRAFGWIIGFAAVSITLGAVGAALGHRVAKQTSVNWTAALAWVTAVTTVLMLVAGGIVTGLEAGLAVEGWIIAEGHLLVLFPITLMQRDIPTFVEHAHRLWGLLVGLTTIVLMVHLWMVDRRFGLKLLAAAVLLAVIGQGILGGTRVTEQSVPLAIAHGVFAQLIFAALVVVAMATSRSWVGETQPIAAPSVRTDRALGVAMLIMIVIQITLGTVFRHIQPLADTPRGALMGTLHGHSFVGSALTLVIVLTCGVRSWGLYPQQRILKRSGTALIHVVGLQVLLGIASFVVVPKGPRAADDPINVIEVAVTTAHQVTGAILLAAAVSLVAWQRRLLR